MLEKPAVIEIPHDNPWQPDKLDRYTAAENLTQLVRSLTQPFVISIASPWGTGKTTFIRMWKQQLTNENQPCIYFNAWENDFSENPFISFIGEIESYLKVKFKDDEPIQKKYDQLKEKAGSFFHKAGPIALKIATRGAIESVDDLTDIIKFDPSDSNAIADFLSKWLESEITDYQDKKKSIAAFKKNLKEFVSELVSKETFVGPFVIFVDELDRCRPTFALELLENIKHIFDVPNIVFVLSVDKDQLRSSVRTLYGRDMSADGYLRRFIDLEYQLEKPDTKKYADVLFDSFRFHEIYHFRDWDRYDFKHSFAYLAEVFKLSLRDQEQCFILFNVLLRTTQKGETILLHLIIFLVALKFFNDSLYNKFLSKDIKTEDLMVLFDHELFEDERSSLQTYINLIEYYISAYLLDNDSFNSYLEKYKSILSKDPDPTAQAKAQFILNTNKIYNINSYKKYLFPKHIKLIELAQKFSAP